MLKHHVENFHKKKSSSVAIRQNQLIDQITKLRCPQSSCGHETFSKINDLKTHLYSHTKKKEDVGCIFCPYKSNTTGSLSSHMSRNHKIQMVSELNERIVQVEEMASTSDSQAATPYVYSCVSHDETDSLEDDLDHEEDADVSDDDDNDDEVFLKALSITVNLHFVSIFLNIYSTFSFSLIHG